MKRVWSGASFLAIITLTAAQTALGQATPPAYPRADSARQVTLREAVALARSLNPELRISQTGVDAAEYNRLDAWGNFLPSFNAGFGYSNSSTGRLDQTGQAITTTAYFFQLTGSYSLFEGFRKFTQLKSARLDLSAEQARYRQSDFQLIRAVKRVYFDALALRDVVQVDRDRVSRQEDQLEFVSQQLELGRATRSDVLRSQVDLNNAKLDLLTSENQFRASSFQLGRTLGVDGRVEPTASARLEVQPLTLDRGPIYELGLRSAPSVVSAEADTRAAESRVATTRSFYLPNLAFSGGWAWANQEFPPQSRSWSLQLTGSYPLFDGFRRESNVYRAQALADAATERQRGAELQLIADLDAAIDQILVAEASVDLAAQTVELSREDLRVSAERYRLGLATILDLQSAQITLSDAEVELISRRFDYQIGIADLESLLGRNIDQIREALGP